ncbi:MAG TPA: OmpA family protein [Anseongella sp.]
MKYIVFALLFAFAGSSAAHAQILERLEKKVKRKVEERIERKTDAAMDKGLDKVEDAAEDAVEGEGAAGESGKSGKAGSDKESEAATAETADKPAGEQKGFRVYSKFDFIPGERVLFYEDFSVDNTGDFPARWNTNGSGEVVSLSGQAGKWLKIPDNTTSFPETGTALPENFTIEFDLFYPAGVSRPPVIFGFSENANPAKDGLRNKGLFYFRIDHFLDKAGYSTSLYSGRETNKEYFTNTAAGHPVRVSISVNKQRIRLYLDHEKLFDLPRAFEPATLRNNFHFRAGELIPAPKEAFYIANLRIAETGQDERSKLITEGKWSTTGILFDVSSARVRPESHGVLKEIAAVLQENPDVNVQIIGHTDSDGSEELNLKLSKDRAASVKAVLAKEFGIAPERMEPGGKGESSPVSDNDSPEGKAQNRRVEFVKL